MNSSQYLAGKRVNIELLLWTNDRNVLHIGVRLRPWKQESRNPEMILVQGLDVTDALNNAAKALYQEQWRRLDYAARPWNAPTFDTETGAEAEQLDFLDAVPLSIVPKQENVTRRSRGDANGHSGPA